MARDLRIVSNGHLCFYAFEFQTSSLLLLYFLLSDAADSITQSQFISDNNGLWSTDVVGRVPHQSPTRLPTRRCCIWAFFFSRIHVESGSIRTDSARIGPNRVVSTSDLNRPKQAEISLELCWNSRNRLLMRPKHPKFVLPQFYSEYLSLLLCFLFNFVFLAFFFLCFVNQGIVMCFLRIS